MADLEKRPHRACSPQPGANPVPLIGLCKFLLHAETSMESCVFETTLEGCKKDSDNWLN